MLFAAPSTQIVGREQAAGRGTPSDSRHLVPAYPVAVRFSPHIKAVALARLARDFSALGGLFFRSSSHGKHLAPQQVARLARWQSGLRLSDDGNCHGNFCNAKAHSCNGFAHQQKG